MHTLLNVNGPWENEMNVVVWRNADSVLVISVDMRDKSFVFSGAGFKLRRIPLCMRAFIRVCVFILAWFSD